MAALPRILTEAGEREREREAARESQELGTLLYLTVTREYRENNRKFWRTKDSSFEKFNI